MNRSKVAAGGLLVAVFVSGAIVGGAGLAALREREETQERSPRRSYVEILEERLGLSLDQRQQIEPLLKEFGNTWQALAEELREEERRRIHEIRIDARAKIIATLDSSQVEVYRQMIARDDSARAERANRRRR
jgi:hypothetical protein